MGTATWLPRMAPHQASIDSDEFSISMATRSPGLMPIPRYALARRLPTFSTSAALNLLPLKSRYSLSGSVSSRRSSTALTVVCSPLRQTLSPNAIDASPCDDRSGRLDGGVELRRVGCDRLHAPPSVAQPVEVGRGAQRLAVGCP